MYEEVEVAYVVGDVTETTSNRGRLTGREEAR